MSASYSYIQPGVTDAVPSLCEWFAPRRVLLRSSFWCYLLSVSTRRVSTCWKVALESQSKRMIRRYKTRSGENEVAYSRTRTTSTAIDPRGQPGSCSSSYANFSSSARSWRVKSSLFSLSSQSSSHWFTSSASSSSAPHSARTNEGDEGRSEREISLG